MRYIRTATRVQLRDRIFIQIIYDSLELHIKFIPQIENFYITFAFSSQQTNGNKDLSKTSLKILLFYLPKYTDTFIFHI